MLTCRALINHYPVFFCGVQGAWSPHHVSLSLISTPMLNVVRSIADQGRRTGRHPTTPRPVSLTPGHFPAEQPTAVHVVAKTLNRQEHLSPIRNQLHLESWMVIVVTVVPKKL